MAVGILATLFGGGIAEPIKAVGNIVDNLFTSDDERLSHEEVLVRLAQKPGLVNQEINKVEAQHRSRFVAGWRPFIGWVCGLALSWNYLIHPLFAWAWVAWGDSAIPAPPPLSLGELMPVLLGMLGLGALRTVEKAAKVSK